MTAVGGAPRSGEEIQSALRSFVARWREYAGTERSEAQSFLNELFACYGTDRKAVGARFEDFQASATGGGFMDLHWPEVCIVEMKRPARTQLLGKHLDQLMAYWRESADEAADRAAARYVVLCSFQRFEIWEPGRFPKNYRVAFDIEKLPERYEALMFLASPTLAPSFMDHYRELTKDAAAAVAQLYQSLADRSAAPIDEIQRFTMQCVWTLFAEDLGMIEGFPLQAITATLLRDPSRSSAAEIGLLFRVLNQKGSHNRQGVLAGTRYVNGELFARPAEVALNVDELRLLAAAAECDWRKVDPTIFGSLMEGVLGRERRWELGAHYTHEVDILKIVGPTIVRPWQERIDACTSASAARALLDELCAFRVLDPACGCGNFLYVAYRELRSLEHQLKERIVALAKDAGMPVPPGPWPYYPLTNLQGIDIEPVAVLIARVTLWMGHRQMIERFGEAEPPLPLVDLRGIQQADALRVDWPETDAIIGNPPFLGDRKIRGALGDGYVEWLKQRFGVGVVDFSAYWFRKAAELLRPGQRGGLVSTNTLRENKHRSASLGYLCERGGVITDAVSTQKWPGDAKVHVSLTNWVMNPVSPPRTFILDGVAVPSISAQLSARPDSTAAKTLPGHVGISFIGCQPTGKGFVLDPSEAVDVLGVDARNSDVVRPFLTSDDLCDDMRQAPTRYVIDFGTRPLEEAAAFVRPLEIVRERVRPEREGTARHFARLWWQFAWPRPQMRKAIAVLDRYAVCTLTGKRFFAAWAPPEWCPSNAAGVFAFEDDFSMGVLLSRIHVAWAWARSSTLETRLRYTPSSVFETFPWAGAFATAEQRETVAEACRRLYARRSEICQNEQIGLTTLYNQLDDGAWTDLKALHKTLDEAVAACYGWPTSVAQDDAELVRRLTEVNGGIAEGRVGYAPFAYLEVPAPMAEPPV